MHSVPSPWDLRAVELIPDSKLNPVPGVDCLHTWLADTGVLVACLASRKFGLVHPGELHFCEVGPAEPGVQVQGWQALQCSAESLNKGFSHVFRCFYCASFAWLGACEAFAGLPCSQNISFQ